MKSIEIIGARIKNRRIALGMSQTELAKKLGYSNKSMISLVESGKRDLNMSQLYTLANALDCTTSDLIDDIDPGDDDLMVLISRLSPEQKEAARLFLQVLIKDK